MKHAETQKTQARHHNRHQARPLSPARNKKSRAKLETRRVRVEELGVAEEKLKQKNEELILLAAELEAEHRRYQDLFEFAPDGYLVTDRHGKILEANLA